MNDLSKLPKWARERITNLERQRDEAVRQLNEFCATQTPSGIWVDELVSTGEQAGPCRSTSRRNMTRNALLEFAFDGVQKRVAASATSR